ncbi:MAG: dUTP diphosphatase [Spirochaetes bacterium]|nr:dUTP diphosphatase [Spirochaetota bacterium]
MVTIKIHAEPGARVPAYQSKGASGADIFAFIHGSVVLQPGDTKLIPTGITMEIPEGYEAQIRPRSGLALNHGITLLNTPGTIDSDYRGEIKIIVTNLGKKEFSIENGMRIAQMVFNKTYKGNFIVDCELSETDRHDGGFGHSGV